MNAARENRYDEHLSSFESKTNLSGVSVRNTLCSDDVKSPGLGNCDFGFVKTLFQYSRSGLMTYKMFSAPKSPESESEFV